MSSSGSPVDALRGALDASGFRVAVIVARFNAHITDSLLAGAVGALREHGAEDSDVTVLRVPGAWELPQTAAKAVRSGRFDAVITLGCVIRGETPHFDYVCQEASLGLGAVARSAEIPVVFGVLTTDDELQARARAGAGRDNKGYEAAMAALEMIHLYRGMDEGEAS
ncbi:MAG: 6,7-dimethyl-8-ribityllumazine synthase [Longimicrobiales bacterium]|nr:6,7-dimethyl-8-ribityllumazine synthase [Longimicrobiales bacterium]